LKEIDKVAFANVCFSITNTDESTKKAYEPYSPSTAERLQTLQTLRKEGIKGGIIAMPMIPFISDSIQNMWELVKEAKRVNAEYILFAGMTLKPGRQKNNFLEIVRKNNPEKLKQIKEIYSNENKYGHPDYNKLPLNVITVGHSLCRKIGVNPRSIRHKCSGEFDSNHHLLQKLLDLTFWMSTILTYERKKWHHFHQFAKSLERGLPDLKIASENGTINRIIDPKIFPMISEIVEKGTSNYYNEIANCVDSIAKKDYARAQTSQEMQ
jgi:hypothetical protein